MLRIAVLESVVHDRQQPGTAVGTRRELMEEAKGAQVRFLKQIFCLLLVSCQVEAGGVNVVFVCERPLLEQGMLVLPTRFLRGHVQTGTTNPARGLSPPRINRKMLRKVPEDQDSRRSCNVEIPDELRDLRVDILKGEVTVDSR